MSPAPAGEGRAEPPEAWLKLHAWAVAHDLPRWVSPIKAGLSLAGLIVLGYLIVNHDQTGYDLRSYWEFDLNDPYQSAMGNLDAPIAFRYAPPFALIFALLQDVPWEALQVGWLALNLGALWWMCRSWALAVVAIYPVTLELATGNLNILIAAALVAGLKWPGMWAFLLLTKLTPAVVFIWFVVRREWRSLAILFATIAVLLVGSALIAPWLWGQWFALLVDNARLSPGGWAPLVLRLPIAVALVAWGAATNRTWVLPIAVVLSFGSLWVARFAVLVALVPLLRDRYGDRLTAPAPVSDSTLPSPSGARAT
jgi:Glycosyltransferase family 87